MTPPPLWSEIFSFLPVGEREQKIVFLPPVFDPTAPTAPTALSKLTACFDSIKKCGWADATAPSTALAIPDVWREAQHGNSVSGGAAFPALDQLDPDLDGLRL